MGAVPAPIHAANNGVRFSCWGREPVVRPRSQRPGAKSQPSAGDSPVAQDAEVGRHSEPARRFRLGSAGHVFPERGIISSLVRGSRLLCFPVPLARASTSHCVFHKVHNGFQGTCGKFGRSTPVFTLSPADGIKSGVWWKDVSSKAVWDGGITHLFPGYTKPLPIGLEIFGHGRGIHRSCASLSRSAAAIPLSSPPDGLQQRKNHHSGRCAKFVSRGVEGYE